MSPGGDFDGPEPSELWGINDPLEPIVIARPAHWSTVFDVFLSKLTSLHKYNQKTKTNDSYIAEESARASNISFYLEYFPVGALGVDFAKDVPLIPFAHFLIRRFQLLWLGGGGRRTVGRLHFDRNENIMAMIRGSKTFSLFDPGQSASLYGDTPLRSASLKATVDKNSPPMPNHDRDVSGVQFSRDKTNIMPTAVDVHSYSPVDLQHPNYTRYPLLRNVRGFECTVGEGEMLYVPSHWWHQVTSHDDAHGKSVGVNYFYEPFYHRPGYRSVPPYMQRNRYYSHLTTLRSAVPCDNELICLRESGRNRKGGRTGKSKVRKSKGGRRKRRKGGRRRNARSSNHREL